MIRTLFAVAASAALLSGCAVTSMEAKIAPQINFAQSDIGKGTRVAVNVLDERPTKDVGKRAAMGAKIKMTEDLSAIIQTAVFEGLRRKGFEPVAGADAPSNLKIEIRSLAYDMDTGWFTGGVNVDASMKAVAKGSGEPYERFYRSGDNDRVVFIPGAKENNKKLNAMVDNVLQQMFDDQKLLEVLASSAAPAVASR